MNSHSRICQTELLISPYALYKPSYSYFSAKCGTMKRSDPTAIMRDPVATHIGLWYLPPIKLTNSTTIKAPISWALGISADLVDVS